MVLHCYCFIDKLTNRCFQILETYDQDVCFDNKYFYSFKPQFHSVCYLNKYFYDNSWHTRTWNEYDPSGIPIEESGYIDDVWEPEFIK